MYCLWMSAKAEKEALARRLVVTGTLSVIEMAAQGGLIKLKPALDRLLQTNFRVSNEVIQEVVKRHAKRAEE